MSDDWTSHDANTQFGSSPAISRAFAGPYGHVPVLRDSKNDQLQSHFEVRCKRALLILTLIGAPLLSAASGGAARRPRRFLAPGAPPRGLSPNTEKMPFFRSGAQRRRSRLLARRGSRRLDLGDDKTSCSALSSDDEFSSQDDPGCHERLNWQDTIPMS